MDQIKIAKSYIGQREKPHNGGFLDPIFEAKMRAQGFATGDPWCMTFAKLVLVEAFPKLADKLHKLLTPGTLFSFLRLKDGGYSVSQVPTPGALVIYQRYKDGVPLQLGHAGIVLAVGEDGHYVNIEGNTNVAGSPEGTDVLVKDRKLGKVKTGLNVLGFITIA